MSWVRKGQGSWTSSNPSDIAKMKTAIEDDKGECGSCISNTPVSHNTGYVHAGGAVTYQCRSRSRWFNPLTEQMEGRPHCTCDSCW